MINLNNKGITLLSLVIMIVVMLILLSVTVYYSTESIDNTRREIALAKIQLIQEKVNIVSQKILNKDSSYVDDDGNIIIGQNINNISDSETITQIDNIITTLNISEEDAYKYFDSTNMSQLGLEDLEDKILVNFNTREVILIEGIKYEDNIYYRLEDISDKVYNVAYENKNTTMPDFSVVTQYLANSCKIIIKDITYSDYINSGEISYKLQEDEAWIKINGTEFEVDEPGIYDIRLKDSAGNQTEKKAYVYVSRDLLLCLDGSQNLRTGYSNTTDTWEDLSINNNDIKLSNFDGIETSGWQENYLYFDGVDDYAKSVNIIDYNETKKLTIQLVDLNGSLYNNEEVAMILENSANFNNNYNAFGISNDPFEEKGITVGIMHESLGINEKYKSNMIRNITTSYTIVCNTTQQLNNFIDIYLNEQKQKELTETETANIENMPIKNYELFIGARNGTDYFSTMNLSNLRIYKTALTEEEININYQIDKARYNIQDNV